MGRTIGTASTVIDIEKMINQYFYSTTYQVKEDGKKLSLTRGGEEVKHFECKKSKGRYKFCEK